MDIERSLHKINKLQIIASIILLVGIVVLSYLSQKQQIIKSKATVNKFDAFEATDTNGNPLKYQDAAGTRVYSTNDLNVNIQVKDIEALGGN